MLICPDPLLLPPIGCCSVPCTLWVLGPSSASVYWGTRRSSRSVQQGEKIKREGHGDVGLEFTVSRHWINLTTQPGGNPVWQCLEWTLARVANTVRGKAILNQCVWVATGSSVCRCFSRTCSLLLSNAGRTSFTVLSTSTPPTSLKHFLVGSTSFRVSMTKLENTGIKQDVKGESRAKRKIHFQTIWDKSLTAY